MRRTFETVDYADVGSAVAALREGHLNGVLTIPPDFSRRVLAKESPRVALIEDNTDGFVSGALAGAMSGLVDAYDLPRASAQRIVASTALDVVEVYPYVPYIQYLLPGSIVMSIFMMVMIGGGIIFIDDKARGLHEGYLVTPITKLEIDSRLHALGGDQGGVGGLRAHDGRNTDCRRAESIRADAAACGCSSSSSVTAMALVSMMFLLMVRMTDPLLPRAIFGVLNTLLYFPSGAVYPQQAFPAGCARSPSRIRSRTRCMRSRASCSRTPDSPRSAMTCCSCWSSRWCR